MRVEYGPVGAVLAREDGRYVLYLSPDLADREEQLVAYAYELAAVWEVYEWDGVLTAKEASFSVPMAAG